MLEFFLFYIDLPKGKILKYLHQCEKAEIAWIWLKMAFADRYLNSDSKIQQTLNK